MRFARNVLRSVVALLAILGCVAIDLHGQGTIPILKSPQPPREVRLAMEATTDTLRFLESTAMMAVNTGSASDTNAAKQISRLREKLQQLQELASPVSCGSPHDPGFRICGFTTNPDSARQAGRNFWDPSDSSGLTLAKMLNIQGLGDLRGQKTYVELVADVWNLTRVSLGGVFKSGDSTSSKSKAQQFLAGGGPAVVTLLRPVGVLNFVNTRSALLARGQASFQLPAQDSVADDSLKFAAVGLDWHTSIEGADKKLSGVMTIDGARVFGGRALYKALGETKSFFATSLSLELVVEQSAALKYTHFLSGPTTLTQSRDLIGVNFTR